jgi:transcriptional regulator with XRE-family HTH domain
MLGVAVTELALPKRWRVMHTLVMTASTGEDRAELRDEGGQGAVPADTFAVRLMLARVHAGYITVKEAAEKCGLNYGSWSNWERGSRPLDLIEVAAAVSRGLGIDQNWLLFGGPLAKPEPATRRRRGDRHGRSQITRKSIGDREQRTHRPFGRRTGTAPTGRRDENDRPRVLRVPTV